VGARRLDALGAGLDDLDGERLGMAPLDLRHTRANGVAGEATPHEDDIAVEPRDAVPTVREGVDPELELLVLRHRRHARSLAAPSFATVASANCSAERRSSRLWVERRRAEPRGHIRADGAAYRR
jgi:hypothetical protein